MGIKCFCVGKKLIEMGGKLIGMGGNLIGTEGSCGKMGGICGVEGGNMVKIVVDFDALGVIVSFLVWICGEYVKKCVYLYKQI